MRTFLLLLAGALALAVLLAPVKRRILVDSCLDGGGRWNYETGECEGRE